MIALLPSFLALAPHPGPPIWVELFVRADALELVVHGEPEPLATCLGLDADLVGPHEPAERAALEAALRAAFRVEPRVSVDGTPVAPHFAGATFPEDTELGTGWLVVDVELRFPLAQAPERVALVWERFDGAEWAGETFVPVTVHHGRLPEVFSVWPAEPELVWHAPRASLADAPAAALPAALAPAAPRWRLPLAALGALLAGALALVLLRRRGLAARWSAVAAACALAFLARGAWVLPLGTRGPARPSPAEARTIFERLHESLYAAFDGTSEDAIYDRLALCVAPGLVDPLYGDVYESLILREQGGAVCSIEGVDVRSCEVRFERAGPGFDVEAAWDVRGLVSHWGHLHRRRNSYRARYAVDLFPGAAPAGDTWKISAIDIAEHERVDE